MLKNMKIKLSLILGFGAVIIISLAIIIRCLTVMQDINREYDILFEEDVTTNESILYCRVNASVAGRNIRDILLVPDSDANDGLRSAAEQSLSGLFSYLESMNKTFPSQLNKDLLAAYEDAATAWAEGSPYLLELYDSYKSTGDAKYIEEAKDFIYTTDTPLQTKMVEAAEALDEYLVKGMADERARVEESINQTILVTIVVMVVATIFCLVFAFALIRCITGPTEQVRRALVGFSEGKLDIPVEFRSKNELGEMCDALRASQDILGDVIDDIGFTLGEMAGGNFDVDSKVPEKYVGALDVVLKSIYGINSQLSDTLSQINKSSEEVSSGAEQVSTGAQSLAQGATEQASSVEELSATITSISNESEQTSAAAREAQANMVATGKQVEEADECVKVLNEAMNSILASSDEIAKIIAVIENIAFQTNILALNAAVEASRAGEAGRGFAVVADEVRSLAGKSDEAAKSTQILIGNSIKSVNDGAKAVERVTEVLAKLDELSKEVIEQVNTVSNAVENQSSALEQVSEGVNQISCVVQTNSATSQESAAVSEELSTQASMMKALMSRFILSNRV